MSMLDDLIKSQFNEAFMREFDVSADETRQVMYKARASQGKSPEAPRGRQLLQSYRTPQAIKAVLGIEANKDFSAARKEIGVDFDVSTPQKRIGTLMGALASDAVFDKGRGIYWLMNAAQATGDVIAEEVIARARPDLYDMEDVVTNKQKVNTQGEPMFTKEPGKPKEPIYETKKQRKYGAGRVQLLAAPAGVAINTGLGLMTPFGGAEGYKAALPSEDDPSKTSNVLGEVAAKYILGRTGDLLPYDEFVKVRPDVSKDEYQRYKAFKFDKNMDLNPFDDGKAGVGLGVLKYTNEGIHGPEVQFLGRSLPVTTGITPFVSSVAGAALGARYGGKSPIRAGLAGGVGGLLGGNVVGNLIEGERRRRNAAENERDTL